MKPPDFEIDAQVDDAFAGQVGADLLTRSVTATLEHQRVNGPAALSVVVTGDGTLRRLNRAYRGIDAPTDVLAFGNAQEDSFAPDYLGDVIISFPQAERQARRAGHPVAAELQLLTVHGVLHLLGHEHAEPDEKAAMWSAQAEILHELGASVVDLTPEPLD